MKLLNKIKARLKTIKPLSLFRDFMLLCLVIFAITWWQTRDMLATNGSEVIKPQYLVALDQTVQPLFNTQKPNLVYFFAPWCQVCALSIGNLQYLNEDKINIVVVALDYSSQEEVADFVKSHSLGTQVLLGTNELKQAFKISAYPSYYLIDANGKITSRSVGYSTALGLKLREAFGD